MRLTEVITIYLAAAAPVGVAYFFNHERISPRAGAVSAGAALVWPITLTLMWLSQRGARRASMAGDESADSTLSRDCDHAKRALLAALYQAEDAARDSSATNFEVTRQVIFNAREAVERFVGLTLAAREERNAAPPSPRETELCRVAGRSGDDLMRAGRCTRRRNVTLLLAHRARARAELLHALAEVGGIPDSAGFHSQPNNNPARRFSEAALEVHGRAIDLLSQFDDHQAAMAVARLLDAECARRRRFESSGAREQAAYSDKGTSCTTFLHSDSTAAAMSPKPSLT